jgi:hypothetical protein
VYWMLDASALREEEDDDDDDDDEDDEEEDALACRVVVLGRQGGNRWELGGVGANARHQTPTLDTMRVLCALAGLVSPRRRIVVMF